MLCLTLLVVCGTWYALSHRTEFKFIVDLHGQPRKTELSLAETGIPDSTCYSFDVPIDFLILRSTPELETEGWRFALRDARRAVFLRNGDRDEILLAGNKSDPSHSAIWLSHRRTVLEMKLSSLLSGIVGGPPSIAPPDLEPGIERRDVLNPGTGTTETTITAANPSRSAGHLTIDDFMLYGYEPAEALPTFKTLPPLTATQIVLHCPTARRIRSWRDEFFSYLVHWQMADQPHSEGDMRIPQLALVSYDHGDVIVGFENYDKGRSLEVRSAQIMSSGVVLFRKPGPWRAKPGEAVRFALPGAKRAFGLSGLSVRFQYRSLPNHRWREYDHFF